MPRRNGTGPIGNGPMTGRGVRPCYTGRVNKTRPFGQGNGRGFGYNLALMTKEDLEQEKDALKQRLEEIDQALK